MASRAVVKLAAGEKMGLDLLATESVSVLAMDGSMVVNDQTSQSPMVSSPGGETRKTSGAFRSVCGRAALAVRLRIQLTSITPNQYGL